MKYIEVMCNLTHNFVSIMEHTFHRQNSELYYNPQFYENGNVLFNIGGIHPAGKVVK